MGYVIKLIGKDMYEKKFEYDADFATFYALNFKVYKDEYPVEVEHVPVNAVFIQEADLTEAFAGITEYGALKFNSVNSQMENNVTIKAKLLDFDEEVEATTTLATLANMEIGTSL